jgi:hypothetical protein
MNDYHQSAKALIIAAAERSGLARPPYCSDWPTSATATRAAHVAVAPLTSVESSTPLSPRAGRRLLPTTQIQEASVMAEHENAVGESNDWFTPKKYFDAFGLTFDLDPAHPGLGTPYCSVPTRKVYTIADDGLKLPWFGIDFVNPPYGPRWGHVPWLKRLIAHGNGIGLFRAYTSADWFHEVLLPAKAVLMFPAEKIKFIRPDGSIGNQPGHGNVFIGLGDVACRALLQVKPEIGVCWDRRDLVRR